VTALACALLEPLSNPERMILVQKKTVLWAVGGVLFGGAIVKMSIIGYYDREMPLILGALAIGAVCVYFASKIEAAAVIDNDDDVTG